MMDNKKLLIAFSVLVIVSLGLSWWLILPSLKNISENVGRIHEEKQKLTLLLSQGQSVAENQKNLAEIETNIDSLEKIWLHTGSELGFITDLEGLAEENSLKEQVINFDNSKASDQAEINIISLELIVTGTLGQLLDYVSDLEALDYYINLERVEIRKITSEQTKNYPAQIEQEHEQEQNNVIITAKLAGKTYWK